MKTAKFWLVQIAMVAIVSLIFGSPVFAGPDGDPSKGKRQGAQSDHASLQGQTKADSNAKGWSSEADTDDTGDTGDTGGDAPASCDGFFFDANGNGVVDPGECY
jgi:hypothetical protein